MYNLEIIASSNTSTNLTYSLRTNGTTVTSSNSAAGDFRLIVTVRTNFSLEYVVKDEDGNTATMPVNINYCYCLNNATCNASQANTFTPVSGPYINYRACKCLPEYQGAFCQTRIDFCKESPCFSNVTCTNNYVSNTADCGSCPAGRVGNGRKCTGM